MPVSIIPFAMPEPAEIPAHIVDGLKEMPPDEAARKTIELLMQIEVADTIAYERIDEIGAVVVRHVAGHRAADLEAILVKANGSLTSTAAAHRSALLVMGQVSAGEESDLPTGVVDFLLNGASNGSIGFNYVLPLSAADGQGIGSLTLMRSAGEGPLNHEQPNICEAMRRELSTMLAG